MFATQRGISTRLGRRLILLYLIIGWMLDLSRATAKYFFANDRAIRAALFVLRRELRRERRMIEG